MRTRRSLRETLGSARAQAPCWGAGHRLAPHRLPLQRQPHLPLCAWGLGVSRLVRRFEPQTSGMCHLMLFHQPVLDALLQLAERTVRLPFWRAFLRCVSATEDGGHMGASEYELYLNFALRWHPERVCLQRTRWRNAPSTTVDPQADARRGHVFVAYHTQYDHLGRRRTDAQGTPDEEYVPRSLACLPPPRSTRGVDVCRAAAESPHVPCANSQSHEAGWHLSSPGYVYKRTVQQRLGCLVRCAESSRYSGQLEQTRELELRRPRASVCVKTHRDDGRRVVGLVAGGAGKGSPWRRGALHGSDEDAGVSRPSEGLAVGRHPGRSCLTRAWISSRSQTPSTPTSSPNIYLQGVVNVHRHGGRGTAYNTPWRQSG